MGPPKKMKKYDSRTGSDRSGEFIYINKNSIISLQFKYIRLLIVDWEYVDW